jgi:hypothetical protein
MKNIFALPKIQKRHIQILLFLLTLAMLVLGAAAPGGPLPPF